MLQVVLDIDYEVGRTLSMLARLIEVDIGAVVDLFGDETQSLADLHLELFGRDLGLLLLPSEEMIDEKP